MVIATAQIVQERTDRTLVLVCRLALPARMFPSNVLDPGNN